MPRILVFFFLFLIISSSAFAYTNDEIYKRNGDVYILIGDGYNKGVFGPFHETSQLVSVTSKSDSGSNYLFSPGESGKAIAVDMFNNIYVLCSDRTPLGKPRLKPSTVTKLQGEGYPMGELNLDANNRGDFFRIGIGANGNWLYCDYSSNWNNHFGHGYTHIGNRWPTDQNKFGKVYSYSDTFWKDNVGNVIIPNGYHLDTNPNGQLQNGYTTKMHTSSHNGRGQAAWIKNYKERYINFWNDYYNAQYHNLSGGSQGGNNTANGPEVGAWDPYTETWNGFEKVFELFQDQYAYQAIGAGCGDSPPGENYNAQPITAPTGKMGVCVTCTGNRYFFSTLPHEMIKVGKMTTGEVDATGKLSYAKPVAMDNATIPQSLPAGTTSIGAATKSRTEDYLYTSTSPEMAVADQWDALGGIKYELMPNLTSIQKTEMNGTSSGNSLTITIPANIIGNGTIEAIAADGNGTVYYGIKQHESVDWTKPDSIEAIEPFTYVPDPNDPNPPADYDKITHKWTSIFSEGWFFHVYRIKENDTTDNRDIFKILLGGNIYKRQDFGYYKNGQLVMLPAFSSPPNLDTTASGGIDASKIDVDIAVVNISGPPTSGDDFAHADIVGPAGASDPAKPTEDYIEEDTQYTYYVENPPYFQGDALNKNENYGASTLATRPYPYNNGDAFIGGYPVSLVETSGLNNVQSVVSSGSPGLVYYFRIVDTLTKTPAGNPKVIAEWWMPNATLNNGLAGKFTMIKNVDPNKAIISMINQADQPVFNSGQGIGKKGFNITFKDPGIYKVQMMAVYLKYNYDDMPFPSWMNERNELGYFYAVSRSAAQANPPLNWENAPSVGNISNFSNTSLVPAWGNPEAGSNPDMRFVAERTVHVHHALTQDTGYITHIKIHGPGGSTSSTVNEDTDINLYATFYVQWAKYFQYYQGANGASIKLDEYNGVCVWNYPNDGLLPNNAIPNAADVNAKTSCISGGAGSAVTGGADINGDGAVTVEDYPYNGFDIAFSNKDGSGKGKYGTCTEDAGPGASYLSDRDWKEIKYHWYVGAYIYQGDHNAGTGNFQWVQKEIKTGNLADDCIVSRINVDSVDDPVPGETHASDNDPNRRMFKVRLNLKYDIDGNGTGDTPPKFVMPLSPSNPSSFNSYPTGCYYLWVTFDYPTAKWEPRDEKLDSNGNPTGTYSYYDLVCGQSMSDSYKGIDPNTAQSGNLGYQVFVTDTEGPAVYTEGNYDQGGTTGDLFPRKIKYTVRDNNPNNPLSASNFGIKVQIDNPSTDQNGGSSQFDNQPFRTATYTTYNSTNTTLDTSINPAEGGDPGSGGLQVDFDKLFPTPNSSCLIDNTDWYSASGGLENNIHRIINLYTNDHVVGPLAENYNNDLYWYVYGSDSQGNTIHDNIPPLYNDPSTGYTATKPWDCLNTITVHDNDPPELSFSVIIPKLNRTITYQVTDDGRDDIFDNPTMGYVDESTISSGNDIKDEATPWLKTALADYTMWDDVNGGLFALDNNNGTERGKCYIKVTGDGVSEPRLMDTNGVDQPLQIYDYFIGQGSYMLDPSDKPAGNTYCDNEFFDFGEFITDKTPNAPHILAIDEDTRVAFEVKARDNVDSFGNTKYSHNLIQSDTVTFAISVSHDPINYTPDFADGWTNIPISNITLISDGDPARKHAIFFTQFRESTHFNPAANPEEVEWFKVTVTDNAGNIRAFKLPFRIMDTQLIDELLKRQKEALPWQ